MAKSNKSDIDLARQEALRQAIDLARSNPNLRAAHEVVCTAQEFYDFLTGKDEAVE